MRTFLFEIFITLFSVCNVFAEDSVLESPTPPPELKCKIAVKILSFENKGCKTLKENEICSIPISVRFLERKCGYIKRQSFSIKSAFINSNLANKLKVGYRKTLKIEEVEQCSLKISDNRAIPHKCHKDLQYTIE